MAMEQVSAIPDGWEVVGGVGGYKKPLKAFPKPAHDWRSNSAGYEFHNLLESGSYTPDEIKAMFAEGKLTKLNEGRLNALIGEFKDYQHMGWYLLRQKDTGKLHIVYRDPVQSYVVEHKLEGDMAIADVPSTPAPRAPRSSSGPAQAPAQSTIAEGPHVQLPNGFISQLEKAGLKSEFDGVVEKYCHDEIYEPKGQNTRDLVRNVVDACAISGVETLNRIADLQRDTKIEPGFYRELRAIETKFLNSEVGKQAAQAS